METNLDQFSSSNEMTPILTMSGVNTEHLSTRKLIFPDHIFQVLLATSGIYWNDQNDSNINNDSGTDNNATSFGSQNDTEMQILPIDMQFNDGHVLAIVVYSLLFVFSAIGNITVLTTIVRWRKRNGRMSSLKKLLFHLATADLLVTFLMMPMEIGWNWFVSWHAGDVLCRLLSFTRIFGLYLSGFILMCISLDRYYAVVHPLSITNSGTRCRKMVYIAWLCSVLCSFPQALIFHEETHPTFTWYHQCVTFNSFPTADYELAYNFFGFTFMYGVPLTTVVGCYSGILWEIWKLNSQSRQATQLRRSTVGHIGRAKTRTVVMTIIIVSTFLVCWTPYNVMCLWYWLDRSSASQVDQRVQKGLFLFACTNSCMNPLIYGYFHFRRSQQRSGGGMNAGTAEGSMASAASPASLHQRSLVTSLMGSNGRGRSMATTTF